ncbi:MAG: DUF3592 domain-containing protein [Spirochaetes bacterium]|nr:DUF3592 domain-containing protein [Spirochaetota bacterium]
MTQKKHIVIFLFVFGAVLTLVGIKLIQNARQSLYWPKAEGVITQSFMDWDRHRQQFANIKYTFTVNGEEITGFQISAKDMNKSNEDLLKEYPVGKKVIVYYDPENPENSLLEPGYSWQSYQALVIGIIILIVAIVVALFYKERSQKSEEKS